MACERRNGNKRKLTVIVSALAIAWAGLSASGDVVFDLAARCVPFSDCNSGAESGIATGVLVMADTFTGAPTTRVDDFVSFTVTTETRSETLLRSDVPDMGAFFEFAFVSPTEFVFFLGFDRVGTSFRDRVGDFEAPGGESIDVFDAVLTRRQTPPSPLAAAVLPSSRSVQTGTPATAFATVINTGAEDRQGCAPALASEIDADFFYQTTDPATNEPTGVPDQPTDLASQAARTFVFGVTARSSVFGAELALEFGCEDTIAAPIVVGLNTLSLTAEPGPVPDVIAVAATVRNDGIVHVDPVALTGAFSVASANVGAAGSFLVSADTGLADLPVALSICETDPVAGSCNNPTMPGVAPVMVDIAEGETPTFAVFVLASDSIAPDPARNRISVRIVDQFGSVRGTTSVAVQTD